MADNPSTENLPVLPIEDLPYAMEVTSDTKFPISQNGMAMKVLGDQFADFARKAGQEAAAPEAKKAAAEAQRATAAADAAEQSWNKAKAEADRSKSEADRSEKLRESIEVDYEALHQAVEDAEAGAVRSKTEASRAGDSATRSESWAVGGTGTRQGEDTNNAKYWAGRAQAEAERASVPPVEGVYNIVLEDRITGERYALLVEGGRLVLLGVSDTLEAASPLLIDQTDGTAYAVIVEDGRLKIEEAV